MSLLGLVGRGARPRRQRSHVRIVSGAPEKGRAEDAGTVAAGLAGGLLGHAKSCKGITLSVAGYLHAFEKYRAALVFDLMEPLRPIADAAVLRFVRDYTFERTDFTIRSDGLCRINPQMARHMVRLSDAALSDADIQRIPRTLHAQCRSFLRRRLCQWLSLRMMVLITGRACTAIAFVFRKAPSRARRSSFARPCRPHSRYFCK
jgi:hypothetical protein